MARTGIPERQTPETILALTKTVRDTLAEIDTFAEEMRVLKIDEIMTLGVPSIHKAIDGAEAFLTAVKSCIRVARKTRGDYGGKPTNGVHPKKRGRKPAGAEK